MDLSRIDPRLLIATLVAFALLCVALGLRLARWSAGRRSRIRNAVAQRGETEAERLLVANGYRVVARQHCARWPLSIDGEIVEVAVRADLVVERRGRRYIAEVKTGERAPDASLPATRRQLLEYSLVFGAKHVLLVDVPQRRIHVVTFPDLDLSAAA